MLRRMVIQGVLTAAALGSRPATALGQDADASPSLKLPADHPLQDYFRAGSLMKAGQPDEAVYWFYRGQLRYRIYLSAHPELPPDGEPAVSASMNAMLGEPINQYAFGDISKLAATLGRVLAWHDANDDPFTPKAKFAAAHKQQRDGLAELRAKILAGRGAIREQRRKNGLPNRT